MDYDCPLDSALKHNVGMILCRKIASAVAMRQLLWRVPALINRAMPGHCTVKETVIT